MGAYQGGTDETTGFTSTRAAHERVAFRSEHANRDRVTLAATGE